MLIYKYLGVSIVHINETNPVQLYNVKIIMLNNRDYLWLLIMTTTCNENVLLSVVYSIVI